MNAKLYNRVLNSHVALQSLGAFDTPCTIDLYSSFLRKGLYAVWMRRTTCKSTNTNRKFSFTSLSFINTTKFDVFIEFISYQIQSNPTTIRESSNFRVCIHIQSACGLVYYYVR